MAALRKYDHELIISLAIEGISSRQEIADAAECSVPIVTGILARARKAGRSIPHIPRVSQRKYPIPARATPAVVVPQREYVPVRGADEDDAERVRADLERRGLLDLIAMLGLAPAEEQAA